MEPIDRALHPYGLRSEDVGGHGDCQFQALAFHMQMGHLEVRARVATELSANSNSYYEHFDEWGEGSDDDTYDE